MPGVCLGERSLYERIFGIDDRGLSVRVHEILDPALLLDAGGDEQVASRQALDDSLDIGVVLQIFDGQISGGVSGAQFLVLLEHQLDAVDALLDLGTMVDMYMSRKSRVALGVDLYDRVEELRNALAVPADGRHYRNAEKPAELLDVDLVPLGLEFVVHVQGDHGAEVHVDHLGGQVEVSLDVGGVHYVDYYVRHRFKQVFPDVEFFRGICGKGVCTGQVDEHEFVPAVFEAAFLGIDGHSAVVADMLMAAGGDVEQGGLSAVRIADEGDADHMAALIGQLLHLAVEPVLLVFIGIHRRYLHAFPDKLGLCFFLAYHFYHAGFVPSQGKLVTQYLIFDRILERGIQYHADLLAGDESHLDQSFPEAAVTVYFDDHAHASRLHFR